jgi:hypothetical protein
MLTTAPVVNAVHCADHLSMDTPPGRVMRGTITESEVADSPYTAAPLENRPAYMDWFPK